MNEHYDAIVLGTGLTECIISGLLSVQNLRVLHMDRNDYYGGESASLNLNQLFERNYGPDGEKPPASFKSSRDYNIDRVPKFIMACGDLVNILTAAKVTRYIEFKSVEGSYVLRKDRIQKIPVTQKEVLSTKLVGMREKLRLRSFLMFVAEFDPLKIGTWKGLNFPNVTMREVYKKFSLQDDTIDFIGHAMALHLTDDYMDEPAIPTIKSVHLYAESLSRFGQSPYIYPLYGLGELPQAFTRLAAVHGGTYMLRKPIDKILYNEDGTVKGVESEGEQAFCKHLIADPTYFKDDVKSVGQVVRAVAICGGPIPNTKESRSTQVILPQKQIGRHHDIYLTCLSSQHCACPAGKYLAFLSTTVETKDPHSELTPALGLLDSVEKVFYEVNEVYEPMHDGSKNNIFLSRSYDATSHFQTATKDVLDIYKRLLGGQELDLEALLKQREEEEKAMEG